jgi:type IV pilus assembly protein PilM
MIWGLDFGDWALKVVRGSYDRKQDTITIDLFDEIVYGELPCGYDASPLDKHREGIVAFRQKHQISPSDVLCVAVSGSEVFSRFINLPPVPESVSEIIRYEARQQIPFDIDDVVWDYQPVKEHYEVGEEIEVGLFALKKERVAELLDLLEPWRENLRVIQDAPLAVYNLLEYEGLVEQAGIVVDIGGATTDVLVLNPPRYWVRTLLVAGDDLTNALVEQFGVGSQDAEVIKRQAGRSAHREQILRVLQPVFDDLVNEIQRSLGYYKSLARDVKFERVLALGSALKMTGLTPMLAGGLQYQVDVIRELHRIKLAEGADGEKFQAALPGLCGALGLVVQGAGRARVRINMVPEQVALAGVVSAKKPWVLAAAVGLLLAVGVLSLGQGLQAQGAAPDAQNLPWDVLQRAEKLQQRYGTAAADVQKVEKELKVLAEPGVPQDVYLELLALYSEKAAEGVYTTRLRFEWMEPADIRQDMALMAPTGMARAARGPNMSGISALVEEAEAAGRSRAAAMALGAARGPMSGGAGRGSGGRATGGRSRAGATVVSGTRAAGKAGPDHSDKSRLVVRFACESSVATREYIETQVFGALRSAVLADNKPAFTEVRMLGDVRDVYRDPVSGQAVASAAAGARRYVAFEGCAVVNLGQPPEPAKGKTAK